MKTARVLILSSDGEYKEPRVAQAGAIYSGLARSRLSVLTGEPVPLGCKPSGPKRSLPQEPQLVEPQTSGLAVRGWPRGSRFWASRVDLAHP